MFGHNFVAGRDFDYLKYLEERSHFDSIRFHIDEKTAQMLGGVGSVKTSVEDASRAGNQALLDLSNGLDSGFENLTGALNSGVREIVLEIEQTNIELAGIRSDIYDLGIQIGYGIEALQRNQDFTNELLSQLLHATLNPDHTWAAEKFRVAHTQLQLNNYVEAQEFAVLAIEGDSNNLGAKTDPAFHYFLGELRCGGFGPSMEVIDIQGATQNFADAAKYFETSDGRSRALCKQGWCNYVSGQSDNAKSNLSKAIEISNHQNFEPMLLLARIHAEQNQKDEARKLLAHCFAAKPALLIVSRNDPVLQKDSEIIDDAYDMAKAMLVDQSEDVCSMIDRPFLQELLRFNFEEKNRFHAGKEDFLSAYSALENAHKIPALLPLKEVTLGAEPLLQRWRSTILPEIHETIEGEIATLERKISQTKVPSRFAGDKNKLAPKGVAPWQNQTSGDFAFVGVFVGAILGAITFYLYSIFTLNSNSVIGSAFAYIWNLVAYGVPGLLFGALLGWLVGVLAFGQRSNKLAKEHDNDSMREYERSKQELPDRLLRVEKLKVLLTHSQYLTDSV